jgi:hypothetical protein
MPLNLKPCWRDKPDDPYLLVTSSLRCGAQGGGRFGSLRYQLCGAPFRAGLVVRVVGVWGTEYRPTVSYLAAVENGAREYL